MPLAGKKLLFVFHHAGLTGASIVLLRNVEFLKKTEPHVNLVFLLPGKGRIESRLNNIGEVEYYAVAQPLSFSDRLKRKLGLKAELPSRIVNAAALIRKHAPDLVYCNTIACSEIIRLVKKQISVPLVWHIHELQTGIKLLNTDPAASLAIADLVIANSPTTAGFLTTTYQVQQQRLRVVYPTLPAHDLKKYPAKDVITIGSSGTALPTKGALAFIELASLMCKRNPDVRYIFRWIGNYAKHKTEIEAAIAERGLQQVVQFTGESENPMEEYPNFALFVSLSLEESFGLALVEAGSLGVPVAAYENAGEVSALVKHCEGVLVPFNDLSAMAEALNSLAASPHQLDAKGTAAMTHCRHYFDEEVLPEWVNILHTITETQPA